MSKKLDEINEELRKIANRLPGLRDDPQNEAEVATLANRIRELSAKAQDERTIEEFEQRNKAPSEDAPQPESRGQERPGLGRMLIAAAVHGGDRAARSVMTVAEARAITGMGESVPADGGFLVGQQDGGELMNRAYEEGKLANLCERIPISGPNNGLKWRTVKETSRANGSRQGGIVVYRLGEGGEATASKTTWATSSLELEKMVGLIYVTEELLQDVAALEAMINAAFAREFAFQMDDEILNGTGAGQFLGVLNSSALVSVSKETGQAAKTVTFENIVKMYARFQDGSASRWIVNKDVFPQLMKLGLAVGTGGFPVYIPGNSLANAPYGSLLGIPVVFAEQAETLGSKGDIVLADLSRYRIIERGGVQQASSIHVKFVNEETAFRFTVRNNGQPAMESAITPYKGSDTVSAFVALNARA